MKHLLRDLLVKKGGEQLSRDDIINHTCCVLTAAEESPSTKAQMILFMRIFFSTAINTKDDIGRNERTKKWFKKTMQPVYTR